MTVDSLLAAATVALQEGVQTGLIDAAGWIVLVGGLLFTALWALVLMR